MHPAASAAAGESGVVGPVEHAGPAGIRGGGAETQESPARTQQSEPRVGGLGPETQPEAHLPSAPVGDALGELDRDGDAACLFRCSRGTPGPRASCTEALADACIWTWLYRCI